jgi:hypothetical protein
LDTGRKYSGNIACRLKYLKVILIDVAEGRFWILVIELSGNMAYGRNNGIIDVG